MASTEWRQEQENGHYHVMWVFPKIRGTFFGVPIIRIIIYKGLYWGLFVLGNYHVVLTPSGNDQKRTD